MSPCYRNTVCVTGAHVWAVSACTIEEGYLKPLCCCPEKKNIINAGPVKVRKFAIAPILYLLYITNSEGEPCLFFFASLFCLWKGTWGGSPCGSHPFFTSTNGSTCLSLSVNVCISYFDCHMGKKPVKISHVKHLIVFIRWTLTNMQSYFAYTKNLALFVQKKHVWLS